MAEGSRVATEPAGPKRLDTARRRRPARLLVLVLVLVALLVVGGFALFTAARAGRDALHAKAALLTAEGDLSARNLDAVRADLTVAQDSLRQMRVQLDHLGPILPVARFIPVVRSQVVAVETFQSAGTLLASAGLRLADAAQKVRESSVGETPVSGALESLRGINASLADGAGSVRAASAKVNKLQGKWLVGPIATARDDLLRRLPRYEKQATSTEEGLTALIRFAGGEGPRRYLFLSQNPDEIRPTGGFIGTYGILSAGPDGLRLDRFEDIARFIERHPNAAVPAAQAGSPFRLATAPFGQSLANVNNLPDFSQAGKLAAEIWNAAGEDHVDGVVSFNPAFMARILGVLGPVDVPDYGETVDQGNLIERFDYYTVQAYLSDAGSNSVRKGFVASMAEGVMQRLLAAPSSQWQPVAEAMGQGFAAREAMAWSSDAQVASTIAKRGWDAALPKRDGDFFYNGEFSYAAKIDRGLQRTFDHHVELHADGSARITTTMTIRNLRGPSAVNPGSLSYITIYGPTGAVLDPSSDPPVSMEPALAGHPAVGWFVNAAPLGKATLKVVWNVRDLLVKGPGGSRSYSLAWLRVPDHSGDVLNLRVDVPAGWKWKGTPPPGRIDLGQDVHSSWTLVPAKG